MRAQPTRAVLVRRLTRLSSRLADMEAVQMLQRFTQVGEFYVMSPPVHEPEKDTKGFLDVLIYDEESDRHVKITWEAALAASCVTELNGATVLGKYTKADTTGGPDTATFAAAAAAGGVDLTAADFITNADSWSTLNTTGYDSGGADKLEPVCLVISRPFIEHAMLSAVLTVGGGDTGATIFGPSDMQISVRLHTSSTRLHRLSLLPSSRIVSLSFVIAGQHGRQDHRRPLHGPLQGGHHQAAERVRHEGHHVQRLPRGWQHQVLWNVGRGGQDESDEAPQHGRHRSG